MFQILQKANMGTTSYGDQIVILWMTLSQLRNTAEALSACSARDSLYQHIFLYVYRPCTHFIYLRNLKNKSANEGGDTLKLGTVAPSSKVNHEFNMI